MTITNIISAIGNNSSIYPLLVRDLAIEAPSKIIIARRENMKESRKIANDATREKFIDEYATSAIWLGGIPATEYVFDKYLVKKGWSPEVNLKLFKENEIVAARNSKKTSGMILDTVVQGIDYNIEKFKNIKEKDVQDAVADLLKVKNNKSIYERFMTKKFIAATAIPTIIMGFILPPLNFALTRKLRAKNDKIETVSKNTQNTSFTALNSPEFKDFTNRNQKITFTGSLTSTIANLRTIDKMAISDGGLTVGRVSTSRNKEEAYVNAFRMIGSMILNFVTPVYIAKGLDKLGNKLFNVNVNLDPLILDNKKFIDAIKENNIELPKSNTAQDLIEFIDTKQNSLFAQFAQKMKKVSYLKSGYRDPRKYVDIEDLGKFKDEFENFMKSATKAGNIEKFAKKAKIVKSVNILANVGISSFLLAGVLPKAQYLFNKTVTGSYLDPGLK
ncbi:MAG: hypothetical protein E7Z87_06935 [Cyanobacteria bacterium SIG26]|nr:hypothetical protein [Cyanobacteria bacterium SIG26]